MIIHLISVFILSALILSGCSLSDIPGTHKIDVQQGNFVTQEALGQVQPGMSQAQVQDILGTPLLTDDFRQNRWDYVFLLHKKGQLVQQSNAVVFFNEQGVVSEVRLDKP